MHHVRCRLFIATSLDGYIADADGGLDWLDPWRGQDHGLREFLAEIAAVVAGRQAWEKGLPGDGTALEGRRVIVLSGRDLEGVETFDGPATELCEALRSELQGDVWVAGGARVARDLMAAGQLDEIELCVAPVLLGAGVPLWGELPAAVPLRLVDTREYPDGVVQMRYERRR